MDCCDGGVRVDEVELSELVAGGASPMPPSADGLVVRVEKESE